MPRSTVALSGRMVGVCSLVRLLRVHMTRKETKMGTRETGDEHCRPEQEADQRVSDEDRDSLVLDLMLTESSSYPWSRDELVRMIGGDRIGTFDSVTRLEAEGLVHRIGEFVFPTRTCRRAGELGFGG
jgi:hypothetical protein